MVVQYDLEMQLTTFRDNNQALHMLVAFFFKTDLLTSCCFILSI